jgi:hypothetical protein
MVQVAVVRYGLLRRIAEFAPEPGAPRAPVRMPCVVQTPRGAELGFLLAWVERETRPLHSLREATPNDHERSDALRVLADTDLRRVREHSAGVDGFRAVGSERLLDTEESLVYYTSTDRVDIPKLLAGLKELLDSPVRLLHIGARQRARVCGGCGVCGRTLCCSSFLRKLEPVTMRMARAQGLDLSPRATAGACGRLKCCLRYENDAYNDLGRDMPRTGWFVRTQALSGMVLATDPLRGKVLIQPEMGRARPVFVAEIEHAWPPLRARLPSVGEENTVEDLEETEGVEPGWSQLAKRLWRRVNPRQADEEGSESE